MLLEAKGVTQLHPNEWGKMGVEWECGGLGGGKLLIVRGLSTASGSRLRASAGAESRFHHSLIFPRQTIPFMEY